jgi:hypothetical protein
MGAHSFLATQSNVSCSGTSTQKTLTGLASTAGLVKGMAASGTNVASGAQIKTIDSATQVTLTDAHTGSVTSVTFTADAFKFALIKDSPANSYSGTLTNYGSGSGTPTTSNLGTDEASGTGYSAGGFALTNISPQVGTTKAYWSFSVNPSWTSATISTDGGIVYNTSVRLGAAATPLGGRVISVHDFGGAQTVSAGTLTVLLPTNAESTALLSIS